MYLFTSFQIHEFAHAFRGNREEVQLEFCTVAYWKNGEIIEEKLIYDKMSLMQQIGLM